MKLSNAAKYFDTCPVFDGYTGSPLFKIQASTFMESAADGSTATRRVISLDPSISIPSHSCLLLLDQIVIVGHGNVDEWKGKAIRKSYWTKLVTDSFRLLTPAQAAMSKDGQAIYGHKKYLKHSTNTATEAELDSVWDVSFSKNAQIPRGYFIKGPTTLYRVSSSYVDVDGFLSCQVDELDELPVISNFASGSGYDPVSDSYKVSSIKVPCIAIDYNKVYHKASDKDYANEPGDIFIVVASEAVTPTVGQNVEIYTGKYRGKWRIVSAEVEYDSHKLQLRRV